MSKESGFMAAHSKYAKEKTHKSVFPTVEQLRKNVGIKVYGLKYGRKKR